MVSLLLSPVPSARLLCTSSSSSSSHPSHTFLNPNPIKPPSISISKLLPPLKVSAPSTQTTTSSREEKDYQDQEKEPSFKSCEIELETQEIEESSSSKFSWRDHWYPVSLVEDLDSSLPTPFQLLNRDLVLWFDQSNSQWVAFDDKCPHRLAPLSEGRLDENGHLQCSYHGWSFNGCGSCTRIPQAASEGPKARAVKSPRACATRFPTMVSQGFCLFGLMRMAGKELVPPSPLCCLMNSINLSLQR